VKYLTRPKLRTFSKIIFINLVVIISYLAFLPNYDELPELTSFSDVLNHFIAFITLAVFLDFGFQLRTKQAFIILVLYGVFIESVQYFLPTRAFDLMDILVDSAGLVFYYFGRKLFFSVI